MSTSNNMNRRKFIKSSAATAATITIVPRHVVAGSGKTPPSEQIAIANIGCGTQGLREMHHLLQDDRIRVVAVCDPNTLTSNYLDWSSDEIIGLIRENTGQADWWAGKPGIPGGREVGQMYVEKTYARSKRSGSYKGCAAYEDFRELLASETDLDAVKIMTPDHLHATISLAAMDRGLDVLVHKPIANRIAESRLVGKKAADSGVITHLLAWSDMPQYRLIKYWIEDGVIGQLKEIHNWTTRPMWKQWDRRPTDRPPIPKGFNWDLWLGPVPDMPYHPNYTHNVFRGWYEFGGGSVADMGHYSLFPLFETFGVTRPAIAATAYGTTTRDLDGNVFKDIVNDVAFPASCLIRLRMPDQPTMPAFDIYWYDGGMKPFPPEELGTSIPAEGMLFVGDKGKIISGFRGHSPRILPYSRMRTYDGPKTVKGEQSSYVEYPWIDHLLQRKPSPGSFIRAQTVSDTINLAAVALRAGRPVEFDPESMRITSNEADNQYLTREYRPGWELGT